LRIVRDPEHDHRVSYPAQTLGHVVVLNLGAWVLGIDPLSKKLLWQHDVMSPGKGPTNVREVVCMSDRTARVLYRVGGELRLGAPLPLTATRLCLATKNGLVALDPVTGARRWVREDVPANCRLFHDGENLFVVRFDSDGKVTATAAYRLLDGAPAAVKDFTALYSRRMRIVDGKLLLSEVDERKVLTMRLHDVAAGKDVWRRTFPAGSLPLLAEDPALTGAVEPRGDLHILEARTTKAVMSGKLEKEHLAGAKAIRLLSDPENVYVAIEGPPDESVVGKPRSLFLASAGLRAVPINGQLYAFQRATGKLRWHNPASNQTLLVSQIERLPVVLLAATYRHLVGAPPRRSEVSRWVIRAIHKHNGKLMYSNEEQTPSSLILGVRGSDDGSTATVTAGIGTLRFAVRR
jgi:outer membrane protein assembly factor BamB